ncbi:hypothetical protein Trydic_g8697 [Trypoxylus dichotomus]
MIPDVLSTGLMKFCADILCAPLAMLINLYSKAGVFPNNPKKIGVKPVCKSGDEHRIGKYRLNALALIFAQAVEKALVKFAESCNIITPLRNAYMQERFTNNAIYMSMSILMVI